MRQWMLRQAKIDPKELVAQEPTLPLPIAQIMAVRGYSDVATINNFLHAEQQPLPSPLLFKDMDKALAIVAEALDCDLQITIFGDYDADGITSTVILYQTLSRLGAQVDYYIPQRDTEGYGLNKEALARLADAGTQLVIACDVGISAVEEVAFANSLGLSVVILDHHNVPLDEEGQQLLPEAEAVVDPKRLDCSYPFKLYCAGGLCLRFAEALYQHLQQDWALLERELLPFAAIATVCDLVDLTGDNRHLVKNGLPLIQESRNPALQALIKANKLADKHLGVYHVGFIIGPCINASGRLELGSVAVKMFLEQDLEAAQELAAHLVELNHSRKTITAAGTEQAVELVKKQGLESQPVIVLHCPEVQESVAGIVAGKVKEYFYRPTIILTGEGELLRGSCRSVEGYDIYEALSACRELLPAFGGHPMAAGLSIAKKDLAELAQRLNHDCPLAVSAMVPQIRIDKQLPLHFTSLELAHMIALLEPYGKGNTTPRFATKNVYVEKIKFIGKTGNVVKFLCHTSGRRNLVELISFNGREQMEQLILEGFGEARWQQAISTYELGVRLDFVYTIDTNEYNGRENLQLQVVDFRLSADT